MGLLDASMVISPERMPFCARCEMPVEKFLLTVARKSGAVVFEVHCHGEYQSVTVPRAEWDELTEITFGPVFTGLSTQPGPRRAIDA